MNETINAMEIVRQWGGNLFNLTTTEMVNAEEFNSKLKLGDNKNFLINSAIAQWESHRIEQDEWGKYWIHPGFQKTALLFTPLQFSEPVRRWRYSNNLTSPASIYEDARQVAMFIEDIFTRYSSAYEAQLLRNTFNEKYPIKGSFMHDIFLLEIYRIIMGEPYLPDNNTMDRILLDLPQSIQIRKVFIDSIDQFLKGSYDHYGIEQNQSVNELSRRFSSMVWQATNGRTVPLPRSEQFLNLLIPEVD